MPVSIGFFPFFFAAAVKSTNEAKKRRQLELLSSLYYIDVYGPIVPENIRLGWKRLTVNNTLAYYIAE
jgi:hypothetical protein